VQAHVAAIAFWFAIQVHGFFYSQKQLYSFLISHQKMPSSMREQIGTSAFWFGI
jgi:hypothetical protein